SAMAKISPHIGSVVSMELGPQSDDRTLPAFLALNGTPAAAAGYFPPEHAPFVINANGGGLPDTTHRDGASRFQVRYDLLLTMDAELLSAQDLGPLPAQNATWNSRARMLMYNSAVDRIFAFDQTERARYGNTAFGNSCITARNLLRARMGTRFIQINLGSWDHHANIYPNGGNPGQLTPMAIQFDNGLGTLMADLK